MNKKAWIPLSEALRHVAAQIESEADAKAALKRNLMDAEIIAQAKIMPVTHDLCPVDQELSEDGWFDSADYSDIPASDWRHLEVIWNDDAVELQFISPILAGVPIDVLRVDNPYVGEQVRLNRAQVEGLWPQRNERTRGGRPPKADWEAIEEAFLSKCRRDGLPDRLNEDRWRTQADVARWIAEVTQREGVEISETQLKHRARQFLEGAKRTIGDQSET